MKRNLTNQQLLNEWLLNGAGESKSGALFCYGGKLWSYNLVIGQTIGHPVETVEVLNYRAGRTGHFISVTTSKHVTRAMAAAARLGKLRVVTNPV